jgi:hypothetical protein
VRVGAPGARGATGAQGPTGAQGSTGPSGIEALGEKGGLPLPSLKDMLAAIGTIYYSVDQQRLVFKDAAGAIFAVTGRQPLKTNVREDFIGPQT